MNFQVESLQEFQKALMFQVRSPVTGMVYKNGSNAVRIKAKTSDLKEYEIFVSNLEVHANYTNQTGMQHTYF